jgi:hypothetical protein
MTATRSARKIASSRSWVMKKIVLPAEVVELEQRLVHDASWSASRGRGNGSSRSRDGGIVEERANDLHPSLHAARELHRILPLDAGEADTGEERARLRLGVRRA